LDSPGGEGGLQTVSGGRLLILPALLAVGMAAALSVAVAQQPPRVAVQDADDRIPTLDLREVDSAFERDSVRFTLITWGRWRARALLDRAFLVVDLDPQTRRRYRVVIRGAKRRLVGGLYLKRNGRDKALRRLRVWRNDRRSVSVRVPARSLHLAAPGRYAWRAQSLVTHSRCPRVCFDRAPDRGDALVEVPAPAPG
jgi:hypothetical protein